MANIIKPKRSNTPLSVPTTSNLSDGELAINSADKKIYLRDGGSIVEIANASLASEGNAYYVSADGSDTNTGTSLNEPFLTVKKALTVATSGDTVRIGSGTFTEVFPLTIPVGVCVTGAGIRSTFIQPTAGTKTNDGFLMNGETEVTDLTIGNMFEPGYAFKFATNMKTTNRSPYVQRVTVLNKGTTTSSTDPYGFNTTHNPPSSYKAGRGVLIDGGLVDVTTLEPAMLFNECTFICPNNIALEMTNGARTEWVNCFTYFADKAIYAYDGANGLGGSGKTRLKITGITETTTPTQNDILYYLQTNSTSGTYSRTGTTITITYNAHGLSNGDRVYADFTSGTATDGYYTISNVTTNTFDVTDTASGSTSGNVSYKKALAYGTISSYTSGTTKLTNKGTGLFETAESRSGKSVTAYGDAKISTAQYKFGTSSLVLDGTGDYIFTPSDADFAYGTGDFTVEMWYRRVGTGVFQILFDQRTASTDVALLLAINTSNQAYVYINGAIRCQGTTALSTGTWHHISVSRTSGSTRLFVNGTQEGATYSDTNSYIAKQIRIGTDYAGNYGVNGYIDEVRVSTSSRYSGAFTPSTTEFVSDTNTKLLLKFEGDNNSVIIKDSTLQVQDVRIVSSAGTEKLTATNITLADYQEFGASMRSIGSAAVFGNSGIVGDGPGVNLRLFAFNFGHIGAGGDFSQDESLVIQTNEVIDSNNANIQFVSIDQSGDFRVGDAFYVNEKKGVVSFGGQTFNITSLSNLDVTDGTNTTNITPTSATIGTISLSSNTISTTSGNLIINPSGTSTTIIEGDVTINGTLSASSSTISGITAGDTQVAITDTGSNGTITMSADGTTIQTITSSASTLSKKLIVNETSGFTGNILDLQVGGTSRFAITQGGGLSLSSGTGGNLAFSFSQLYLGSSTDGLNVNTAVNATTLLKGSKAYGWCTNDGNNYQGPGLTLFRDADGILAQRGTTAPGGIDNTGLGQTFRIYNTWTNSTNSFERANLGWSSNTFIIGTEKGSTTGTARPLEIRTDGTAAIVVGTDQSVEIKGNLTVQGTTTTINSTTSIINDPIIELRKGNSITASDGGIQVNLTTDGTGTVTSYQRIQWNNTNTRWETTDGTTARPIASTTSGLNQFASTTSSQLAGVISDETGSGSLVFATSPTLSSPTFTSPILGTPTSGTLTNCTGYPVASLANLGTGIATFLTTPSSANLISAVTDETGTGSLVFATSPTLVTPLLGTPTSGTLTNCTGYPVANLANLGTGVATFLTTPTSANLLSIIGDETGTGALVFANTPTLVTPVIGAASGTSLSLSGTAVDTLTLTSTPPNTNGNKGFFSIGPALNFNDTNKMSTMVHSVNSYAQMILQNQSNGTAASADFIVNNDTTGGSTVYGDFGINSTGFTGGGAFGDVSGTYLYGSGGTCSVGTLGAHDFKIGTNNIVRMTVSSTGAISIPGTLSVTGAITATGGLSNALTPSTGLSLDAGTTYDASAARTLSVSANTRTRTINVIIDGGGAVITTGVKADVVVDFNATIVSWDILGDVSGTLTVDVSKATYTNFPTFTASGGTSPSLSAAQKNQTASINWTNFTTITAGDILRFTVSGTPATVTRATVSVQIIST